MTQSLAAGKRVELPTVGLFADGAAVKLVGEETFRLCQEYVDEMILVDNDAICAAIKDVFEDTRSILEPAGALAVAGAKEYAKRHNLKDKTLVAIASGANMNFDRLRFVAERAEVGEQREAVLAVTIPRSPAPSRSSASCSATATSPSSTTATPTRPRPTSSSAWACTTAEGVRIAEMLQRHELPCLDLTDDEMAKSHIRYMVGGHAPQAENEVLYRFEFPERPGALLNFLDTLRSDWNISLFHYRNHGADFGRVLVGMQVPPPTARLRGIPGPPRLRIRRRNRQPGLQDVPRLKPPRRQPRRRGLSFPAPSR
jgi:threonine dehydratase